MRLLKCLRELLAIKGSQVGLRYTGVKWNGGLSLMERKNVLVLF